MTSGRPAPDDGEQETAADALESGPAWDRLVGQAGWYEGKSATSKRSYATLKVTQLIAAAAVPVMASVHAAVWVTGGLGALVVVVEGVLQLFQFEANWINYRSTGEALSNERFLYLAGAGPYATETAATESNPKRVLADRVAAITSQENTKWASGRQQPAAGAQVPGAGKEDGS